MATTLVRQNFHEECEGNLNKTINLELYASYVYLDMAFWFDRDDSALPGLHAWFKQKAHARWERAQKLWAYQNARGGRVVLQDIKKPDISEYGFALDAFKTALDLDRKVNQGYHDCYQAADNHKDPQMCDWLNGWMKENYAWIKQWGDHICGLKRVGQGLGEHTYVIDWFGKLSVQ